MKPPRLISAFASLLCVLLLTPAVRAVSVVAPEAQGFSKTRLERLDAVIQVQIDQQQLAGAVLFISRNGQPVRFLPYGMADIENKKPMTADTIFRLASMSKAVTTVAALILYEEGRFMLNDPVAKYIPAFASSTVVVPPPAGAGPDVKYTTVPAKRPITIRDLMTHTAGLSYGDGSNPAAAEYKAARVQGWYFADHDETIGEAMERLAKLPLAHSPGEALDYGFGTDLLGYLVEVVSGMPLDRFMEQRIFRPLQMLDAGFYLPEGKAGRLANVYGLENGKLVLKETAETSAYVHGPRKCFSGGAGLLATAGDYARFLQMLLNGGELDGVRLLSPKTVELMHVNHVGELFNRGNQSFGLGFWINDRPGRYGELIGEGAYGWGSAYFPEYLIDPQEKIVAILMAQLRPTGGSNLNHRFKIMTYQALMETRTGK